MDVNFVVLHLQQCQILIYLVECICDHDHRININVTLQQVPQVYFPQQLISSSLSFYGFQ